MKWEIAINNFKSYLKIERGLSDNSIVSYEIDILKLSSFILNKDLNLTLAASGNLLGNKNHATVLSAVRFVEGSIDSDFDLRYNLQKIRNSLKIF